MSMMRNWVLSISALVMFLVAVEMLVPSGKMKKYMSFVTGFVLIIAILNPLLKLIGASGDLESFQILNSNYMDKMEIENNSGVLNAEQNKQIVEVYRMKIIKQIEDNLKKNKNVASVKGDVIINEDYNSEVFGEILRVYAEVDLKKPDDLEDSDEKIMPVDKVKRVTIGKESSNNKDVLDVDPDIEKQLEDSISELFEIKKENIVISRMMR